jgi:hypothetical protein
LLAAVALVASIGSATADTGGPVPAATDDAFAVALVRVDVPTWEARDRLTNLGLDLTEHAGRDYVEVVLHRAADAELLRATGFSWTVVIPDLARREAENNRVNAEYAAAVDASPLPSGRDTYRTLADYEADLATLADDHPALVRAVELPHATLEGRTVRGVEISEGVRGTGDGKPTFVMLGLHHAREWPSGEHAIEFAFDLARNYGVDARITDLLRRARVVVVPVVNADGFHQSRTWGDRLDLRSVDEGGTATVLGTPGNAYKRKNCRVLDGVATTPPGACELPSPGGYGIGIDLNRNYGGAWGGGGASDVFADPTYRGPAPFSEPETQNVRELISSRHVTVMITNHTFSNLVLRPPGVRAAGVTVDEPAMKDLGARMAAQNGYRNIHGWQLYDTTGTTEDWSYAATGGYGYTFEIGPREFHPPFPEVVDEYLGAGSHVGKGNREAYLLALETAADPAHHSVLTGRVPAGAVISLAKTFETATSNPDHPTVTDTLSSSLVVGDGGRFTWHVNPSTRPEVMEHRVRLLADAPMREEKTEKVGVVWGPGDHVDIPFTLTETGAQALKVNLDWPTPDDLDLEVYEVRPDGSLLLVGSSGEFVGVKEEALVELPNPGDYLLRAINFASATTAFTMTAGVYAPAGEEVTGGGIVEAYTLTCSSPGGEVLQTVDVVVDRGRTRRVDLRQCAAALRS